MAKKYRRSIPCGDKVAKVVKTIVENEYERRSVRNNVAKRTGWQKLQHYDR